MNVQEIKAKYLGDDDFTKIANKAGHERSKYKGKVEPKILNKFKGVDTARAYEEANQFKYASVIYTPKGWMVVGRKMGRMQTVEAQAYAQDILKAVDAIKKAPAVSR